MTGPARWPALGIARLTGTGLGILVVAWALTDPRFRNADGYAVGAMCFAITIGLVFIAGAWVIRGALAPGAALFLLAFAGQAAALQAIDAGPHMRYQHYRSVPWMAEHAIIPLMVLALQTVVAMVGAWRARRVVATWLRTHFVPWQLAVCGIAFVLVSATVSRDVVAWVSELALASWLQATSLVVTVMAAARLPDQAPGLARWREWFQVPGQGWDRVVLGAALAVLILSATLSVTVYQRHPHIGDEVSYLYQARYLASGSLWMPRPPVIEAFTLDLFDYDATRWFASAPPGWPMVLAVGVLFGVPWLVNPLLAGTAVVLTWVLVRDLSDHRTARLAALLLASSPWHLFVGMSYMTHSASLAFALGGACAVMAARRTGSPWWALAGGLATGMVGMIRPLEGMVVAGLMGLWVLGIGGRRLRLPAIVAWGLGGLAIGGVIAWYNLHTTGKPGTFAIMEWANRFMGPGTNSLGFGPDRGVGWALDPFPGHGLRDVVVNADLNLTTINTELFGWAAGSLCLVLARLFLRPWRRLDSLMLVTALAVAGAHSFYWFSGGPDFAARYWYLVIVPLVTLTASAVRNLASENATQGMGWRVNALVAGMAIMAFATFVPWRSVDKYFHYLGMRPDVRSLAAEHQMGRSLVLIRGAHSPDFASAATFNPIDLRGADGPVYAWDSGWELRGALLPVYADRPVWIVEGPSLTGSGYRIVEGPVSADLILERDRESRTAGRWTPPYAERLPEEFRPAYATPRVR